VAGRNERPSAAIFGCQTAQSAGATYETGHDAGEEAMAHKRYKRMDALGLVHGGSSNAPSDDGSTGGGGERGYAEITVHQTGPTSRWVRGG
jgi:hypothetical protein